MADERQRVDGVFKSRTGLEDKYSPDNPGNAFNLLKLSAKLSDYFRRVSSSPQNLQLLDTGSGQLFWPELFVKLGLSRQNCIGSDLLHWRLAKGHREGRSISSVAADSSQLPFGDNQFDIVSQFTLMTSVLDEGLRQKIAKEMMRVLKPGGFIIWYDFRYNNPGNDNTRAIGRKELWQLYAPLVSDISSITVVPPLARKIPKNLTPLLTLLHLFPMLRSHYIALIGPKG